MKYIINIEDVLQNNILMPGDLAGNYDEKWTKTFDLKFLRQLYTSYHKLLPRSKN